ncbi:MAG: AAA family ATPase [Gemmatimonadales bacterium]
MTLASLELVCLGPPTARVGGQPAPPEVLWRKNLALLIYLALSPGQHRTRGHLTGLLWPDTDEPHARHSLNESVRRLRLALGAERLTSAAEEIRLNPRALEVDVHALEAAAGTAPLTHALAGEFLEAFGLDDAPGFEEWAAGRRARYRAVQIAALVAEGERRLNASDHQGARDLGLRALALDPFGEPAARLVMRAAALAGDGTGALKVFRDLGERLGGIGERPSPQLLSLAQSIRSEPRRAPVWATTSEPRFVGQGEAYARAARVVAQVAQGGRAILLVSGPPGSGKSRFLRECGRRFVLEGGTDALIQAVPSDSIAPWSTLGALLRADLIDAPGLLGATPDALAVLAAICPRLSDRVAARAPRDQGEVADALAAALESIGEERPLALGIDDIDRADGPSVAALFAAMLRARAGSQLLMLTAGGDESEWPLELLQALAAAESALPVERARLEPLSDTDLRQLIADLAPWCADDSLRDRLARRIGADTAGSPLLAVALLRDLTELGHLREGALEWPAPNATLDATLPIAVPQLVRHAILARAARLTPRCRAVVAAASIGDVRLDLDLIAALVGLPRDEVEQDLPQLERQHLVIFDGRDHRFATPIVARVLRQELLTAGHAARLRRQAIEHLAVAPGPAAVVLRAELLCRSTPGRSAADQAVVAARTAFAAGHRRLAVRALRAAERAVGDGSDDDRAAVEAARSELLGSPVWGTRAT